MIEIRSVWSGSLTFGLVSIPVNEYAATDDGGKISFSSVHRTCMTKVTGSGARGATKRCPHCSTAVLAEDIVKAYDADGTFVKVDESELEAVVLDGSDKTLEIVKFVKNDNVGIEYFGDLFHLLGPASGGAHVRSYMTLTQAMQKKDVSGIARQIKSGYDYVWLIRPVNGVLGMVKLRRAAEVRTGHMDTIAQDVIQRADGNWPFDGELQLAQELIDVNMDVFDPGEFEDRRQEALAKVVQAALKGTKVTVKKAVAPVEPADITATLKASIAAAKEKKQQQVAA